VWTPGWYTIENYAKNIFRFRVTDPGGRRLPLMQVRKQTWRVETKGISRIKVEFEYLARSLAVNSYGAFVTAGAEAQPDAMVGQASHEFFHLWNVKRIRPVADVAL
jgi:predicted metalloprotease with PDZ domain